MVQRRHKNKKHFIYVVQGNLPKAPEARVYRVKKNAPVLIGRLLVSIPGDQAGQIAIELKRRGFIRGNEPYVITGV